MVFLDFEQPLEKLYEQLEKIRQVDAEGIIDVSDKIKELETKIKNERKEIYSNLSGWQKVQLSRHPERPYSLFYINQMCRKFVELHGDRYFKDDKAIVGGLGSLDGQTVVIIGHQKGGEYQNAAVPQFWHGQSGRLSQSASPDETGRAV